MIHYKDLIEILDYVPESGKFYWKKRTSNRIHVGDEAGHIGPNGYVMIGIKGVIYYGHRLAWLYMTGNWPKDQIDHKNGDRSNNRIENLREATNADNCQNKRTSIKSNKSTKLLGSYLHKPSGRFIAAIGIGGKSKYLGYFDTAEQAHLEYVKAKRELHGFCQI